MNYENNRGYNFVRIYKPTQERSFEFHQTNKPPKVAYAILTLNFLN